MSALDVRLPEVASWLDSVLSPCTLSSTCKVTPVALYANIETTGQCQIDSTLETILIFSV